MRLQQPVPFNALISVSPTFCPSPAAHVGPLGDGSASRTPAWWSLTSSRPSTEGTMGKKTNTGAQKHMHNKILITHSYKHVQCVVFSSYLSAGGQRTTVSSTAWLLTRGFGTASARRDPPGRLWTWMRSRYRTVCILENDFLRLTQALQREKICGWPRSQPKSSFTCLWASH